MSLASPLPIRRLGDFAEDDAFDGARYLTWAVERVDTLEVVQAIVVAHSRPSLEAGVVCVADYVAATAVRYWPGLAPATLRIRRRSAVESW